MRQSLKYSSELANLKHNGRPLNFIPFLGTPILAAAQSRGIKYIGQAVAMTASEWVSTELSDNCVILLKEALAAEGFAMGELQHERETLLMPDYLQQNQNLLKARHEAAFMVLKILDTQQEGIERKPVKLPPSHVYDVV